MHQLSTENIQALAPSVFATQPYNKMSEKYRYIPTSDVLQGLLSNGFVCVSARQSNTRIEGKGEFTKHMLRFRHSDMLDAGNLNGVIPEIVLLNSHDGSSSYQIDLGLFRKVCMNGLHVKSEDIQSIRVRHSGKEDIVNQVIEGSYQIIEDAPKVIEQVNQWRSIQLERPQQEAFAEAAIELRESTLDLQPKHVLLTRRVEDQPNDLWTTFNRVQENLIKGGMRAENVNNQRRKLRAVTSVDGDTKLNRALWILTERMAKIAA